MLSQQSTALYGAGPVVVIVEGHQVSVRVHHRKASHFQIHEARFVLSLIEMSPKVRNSAAGWECCVVE